MEQKYIRVMLESLNKKEKVLLQLIKKSEEQKDILSEANMNWDRFDINLEEKDILVQEILRQDEGFQGLYDRIKEPLVNKKELYREEISLLQEGIRKVTELGTRLEAMEQRNKKLVEARLAEGRQTIKQSQIGSRAAAEYYQRMNKINTVDPQLMDKKS